MFQQNKNVVKYSVMFPLFISLEFLGPFMGDMESLPIDGLSKMFSDLNLPMTNVLDQVNGIQESITSAVCL